MKPDPLDVLAEVIMIPDSIRRGPGKKIMALDPERRAALSRLTSDALTAARVPRCLLGNR